MKGISFFVLLVLSISIPLYADVNEPKTGVAFKETMDFGGKTLNLSGTGVRTKYMVKVYAGALYLDPSANSELASFKGQAEKPTQALFDKIIQAPFTKLFVLHFVRDVDGGKITEGFQEGLETTIDIKASDVQKDAQAFLTAAKVDIKEGQEIRIGVSGDEVTVTTPAATSPAIKNAKLAAAVTSIWLGKEPVSEDLKKGMIKDFRF